MPDPVTDSVPTGSSKSKWEQLGEWNEKFDRTLQRKARELGENAVDWIAENPTGQKMIEAIGKKFYEDTKEEVVNWATACGSASNSAVCKIRTAGIAFWFVPAGGQVAKPAIRPVVNVAIKQAEKAAAKSAAKKEATLFHYTDEAGLKGILDSKQLNPSLKSVNPRDAFYGDGQYLSDILPGTRSCAQLSRCFIGQPFQGQRFKNYVEIEVSGLNVINKRNGVFVAPGTTPLDISSRLRSWGAN